MYELAADGVLTLITSAITDIVSTHISSTMQPVELHETIIEEHRELARAIAGGYAAKSQLVMAPDSRAQHDYYRERWPARLDELIEWR